MYEVYRHEVTRKQLHVVLYIYCMSFYGSCPLDGEEDFDESFPLCKSKLIDANSAKFLKEKLLKEYFVEVNESSKSVRSPHSSTPSSSPIFNELELVVLVE